MVKTCKNMENHAKTCKNMENHAKTWKNMENHGKTWKQTWKIHEHIKKTRNSTSLITQKTTINNIKNDPSGLGKAVDPKKL